MIVAFVSTLLALTRPRNTPRMTLEDPIEASIRGKIAPLNPSCTRRIVQFATLNVHSSVSGSPSKTITWLGGCDVIFTTCDSVGEES